MRFQHGSPIAYVMGLRKNLGLFVQWHHLSNACESCKEIYNQKRAAKPLQNLQNSMELKFQEFLPWLA